MTKLAQRIAARPLVLRLSTAAELMTRSPLSFETHTSIHKASAMLDFYELAAAPVVDEFDRPVGVVTQAHCAAWQEFCVRSSPDRTLCEDCDYTTVTEIMCPVRDIVHEDDPSRVVIETLLRQERPRIYVVNDEGELSGVVSTSDLLRHLLDGDVSRHVEYVGNGRSR